MSLDPCLSLVDCQAVIEHMSIGFALHEVITDECGQVVDYRFLEVNPAFEALTGLSREAVLGRRVLELLPDTEQSWIRRYGKVAQTGRPDTFDNYAVEHDKHFQVSAFCPKLGQFAVTFTDISAHKATEQALRQKKLQARQAEEELLAIYQSTPIMMIVVDGERRVVKVNQATLTMTGLSEQQALGRRSGELFNCVHAASGCGIGPLCHSCLVRSNMLETLQSGALLQELKATLQRQTEQGVVQHKLSVSSVPVQFSGERMALICITDITELAEERRQRHESEERYRLLVEEGFEGVFIHHQLTMLSSNRRFAEMLGRSQAELIGTSVLDFIAPNYRSDIRQRVSAGVKGAGEVEFLQKDGDCFPVDFFSAECRYQGEPARIVAVRDISERKAAIARLRENEQRFASLFRQFETLLDAIADPICLLSRDLELLWVNQAYRQLQGQLGCDEDGLAFRTCFADREDYPPVRCLQSKRRAAAEVKTLDGRTWQLRAFPQFDEAGEVTQVIIVAIDDSEKQRLFDDAMRSNRLASLGVLSAGVAHEINNPNAVVLYNSEILLSVLQELFPYLQQSLPDLVQQQFCGLSWAELEQELPGLLTAMQGAARRIKRIVDDLRDFVRQENQQELVLLELNEVAETAIRLVENTLRKSTDQFQLDLASDLPPVKGDAGRLEQVIINLLLNACQALENSSQAIVLKTRYLKHSRQLLLSVRDQGQGIAPEILDNITEPFLTTKRAQGGTGLGLSVTDRIVKEHGGCLSFESQPGQGTCVSLLLPVVLEEGG